MIREIVMYGDEAVGIPVLSHHFRRFLKMRLDVETLVAGRSLDSTPIDVGAACEDVLTPRRHEPRRSHRDKWQDGPRTDSGERFDEKKRRER